MSDNWLDAFDALTADDENHEARETIIRAPWSYPGNKEYELEHILKHLPQTSMYIEVFGGTGITLLNRKPSKLEVFNDRNSGITAMYMCMYDQRLLAQLCERLRYVCHSRELFVWSRDTWQDCTDTVERAARWYYSIQSSFIKKGKYFGRSTNPKTAFAPSLQPELELWWDIHQRIYPTVQIENASWQRLFKDYNHVDAVWYLDPPYYGSNDIYQCEMADKEHVELLDKIQDLKGFVALSGYPNELYKTYPWDEVHTWPRTTKANALASTDTNNNQDQKRVQVTEALWIRHPK